VEVTTRDIVVAVTGVGRETPALRFAADRARRLNGSVVLVHVVEEALTAPPEAFPAPLSAEDLSGYGQRVLEDVAAEFESLTGGDVPCRTVLREGFPSSSLVALSHQASLVVVQHQDRSALGRIFVGSTAARVAAHAGCPVVVVPSDWEPMTDAASAPGAVVVGVHAEGGPEEVVREALAEAGAIGATLHAVYAWPVERPYADVLTPADMDEWRGAIVDRLTGTVRAAAVGDTGTADVPVEVDVPNQPPIEALVEAAQGAALLVVGRHKHSAWLPDHLGSTTRTLLREAVTPVMVVPVTQAGEASE
jgi:nucleotide-binding universal stress UspA family protein